MHNIISIGALCATLVALALSAPVGPNGYSGPHSSNGLHRSGPSGGPLGGGYLGSRQGSGHGLRPYSAPYGGPSHLRAPQGHGNLQRASQGYGSHLRAPQGYDSHLTPRHSGGQASYHQSASASSRNYQSGGNHLQGRAPSYHQNPATNHYAGPAGHYGQSPQGGHHSAQSHGQSYGREMKYTVRDPHSRGTTHVTETHVVSNRQMHGAEAEAAMKELMGSMGPGGHGGFQDLFKGSGLPFY